MIDKANSSTIYKLAIFIFVLLIIAQFNENEIAGLVFNVLLNGVSALYVLIFVLVFYIFSAVFQKIYGIGNSLFIFYLALIYAGNFIVVLYLGYDMPIHILITAPLVYFSSVYFFTNYFKSVRKISSDS